MAIPRPGLPGGPYLIVGLGRSGLAALAALRAADPGATVVGVDSGEPAEAAAERGALAAAGIEIRLRSDGLAELERLAPATVVKSPGVLADAAVVVAARRAGATVVGELELAWRMLPNPFVAITATNGKTTTTVLAGRMLEAGGVACAVVGNVGTAASSLVGRVDPGAVVVCEASSFQLEDTVAFRPDVAVFLNLSPDHLDRHGTMERYFEAKLNILARQEVGDVAVLNAADPWLRGAELPRAARRAWFSASDVAAVGEPAEGLAGRVRDGAIEWGEEEVVAVERLALRGRHNLENSMAAAGAALTVGARLDGVRETLTSFAGVPNRLEEVRTLDGVLYVNDSKATNVAAARVGLESFPSRVHAILGGSLKGAGFAELKETVVGRCRSILVIGEATDAITGDLEGIGPPIYRCGDLQTAVWRAWCDAAPGDVVLLSPACASFDQFRDYEDRGERFRKIVRDLPSH